jgi:predicted ATPase
MSAGDLPSPSVPRLEALQVRNYRALQSIHLRDLTPLTVFLGPNGSGKSTLFDVFAFLSEAFRIGLRRAWDRRGRFAELRTRGQEGPIEIEIKYREEPSRPIITYHIAIEEDHDGPRVAREWLQWRRRPSGRPFRFLNFENGAGEVVSGEAPDELDARIHESLASPDVFAVNTLGQFRRHPRVAALRAFITGWYLSYLTADNTRTTPEAGPQEHLSQTGDNLPNVIQYLRERHPERLQEIERTLARRVPVLRGVQSEIMRDGRLLLQILDAPFEQPVLSRYASDGTLKLLAYLTVLFDPQPPPLVGIEEPENHLHPRVLPEMAEECRMAAARCQILVSTHSPHFVDAFRAREVWTLRRDEDGYTVATRADAHPGIREFMEHGAKLGQLWLEGYLPSDIRSNHAHRDDPRHDGSDAR